MIKWLKSLFCRKRTTQKCVLEKIVITNPIKKKRCVACKKNAKHKGKRK